MLNQKMNACGSVVNSNHINEFNIWAYCSLLTIYVCVCAAYTHVYKVVPLVGGPCSLCRQVEERSSGGRQNRRGCRSSASPPLTYPWSGERRCPTTGSPGTHTHTYTHGHKHTGRRPADQYCTQAQTCAHADMRGQRNTQGNAYIIVRVIKTPVWKRR